MSGILDKPPVSAEGIPNGYAFETMPPGQKREEFSFDPASETAILISTEDDSLVLPQAVRDLLSRRIHRNHVDSSQTAWELQTYLEEINALVRQAKQETKGINAALVTIQADRNGENREVIVATVGMNRVFVYQPPAADKPAEINQVNIDSTVRNKRIFDEKLILTEQKIFGNAEDPSQLLVSDEINFKKRKDIAERIGTSAEIHPKATRNRVATGQKVIVGSAGLDNLSESEIIRVLQTAQGDVDAAMKLTVMAQMRSEQAGHPRADKRPITVGVYTVPPAPERTPAAADTTVPFSGDEPVTATNLRFEGGRVFKPGDRVDVVRNYGKGPRETGWEILETLPDKVVVVHRDKKIEKNVTWEELREWNP